MGLGWGVVRSHLKDGELTRGTHGLDGVMVSVCPAPRGAVKTFRGSYCVGHDGSRSCECKVHRDVTVLW